MSTPGRLETLLRRARSRLGTLRPARGRARDALLRGLFFGAFVIAVSLVGRAWALTRAPGGPVTVAEPLDEPPRGASPIERAVESGGPLGLAGTSTPLPRLGDTPNAGPGEPTVNLNSATTGELETLPYVGPKRAMAIVALRTKLGRFKSVDELLKVKGIGRGTLKRMRPLLTVGPM